MENNDIDLGQSEPVVQTSEAEVPQLSVENESVVTDQTTEESADETAVGAEAPDEVVSAPEETLVPEDPPETEDPPAIEDPPVAEAAVQTAPTDEELFLAALEGDMPAEDDGFMLPTLERGQIVEGIVVSKSSAEILVDVGAKSEGIIPEREMEYLDRETKDALEVGSEVYVYVLTPEDREGHILLSLRRAMEEQDWRDAEDYLGEGRVYRSKIAGYNKGGLIVRFGKVRGFVPASQVSRERRFRSNGTTPDERWGHMVGEEIAVKVIEVDRGRNRLILSERAATKELRVEMRAELLETLAAGQVYTGRVTRLVDFGAFVDIGGVDGLVHLSELDWKPVSHPREVLRAGDEIEVEVIHVDKERQRIGLSRKNRLEDPWETVASKYNVDQLVQGTVTKMTKFGAFARLVDQPEIEGLIHISELAERRVGHPREVVEENQVLTLRVIRIDPERRRMGLSLKRVDSEEYLDDDWHTVIESLNDEPDQAVEAAQEAPEAEETAVPGDELEDGEVAAAAAEEPVEELAEEPVEELAEEPVEELAEEPEEEPVEELAEEPEEELAEEPEEEPAEEPEEEPAEEPSEESVEELAEEPEEEADEATAS
jgi:small subunit ribosomal protein S1